MGQHAARRADAPSGSGALDGPRPGLAIVATVLAFSVIAEGIRVALDTSIGQSVTPDVVEVAPNEPALSS